MSDRQPAYLRAGSCADNACPVARAGRHPAGLAGRRDHRLPARRASCPRRPTWRGRLALLLSGELVHNIWVSFWRASVGFAIGGGIGFAFGLANGLSQRSERLTDTTLQMVRNMPHLALIPLVILWFGIDETAKIFLVALGVFFPIYVNTLHGIRTVDPQLVEMGRTYGMPTARCSAA